jgi:hypothetical protein
MSLVSTIYLVLPANAPKEVALGSAPMEVPWGHAALYSSHLLVKTRKALLFGKI